MSSLKLNGPEDQTRAGRETVLRQPRKGQSACDEQVFRTEVATFKHLCRAIDTPYARRLHAFACSGDWMAVVMADPPNVEDSTFADDYLIYSVMRKNPRLPIKVDRREAAKAVFYQMESLCCQTNQLIDSIWAGECNYALPPEVIHGARKFIARVLGPLGKKQLELIGSSMRYGPGASYHCTSARLCISKKIEAKQGFTPRLAPFLTALYDELLSGASGGFTAVQGGKAAFVPKTALIDRFIVTEPAVNSRGQLGIGAYLKTRLARFGLDLTIQADRNRKLAAVAQKDGLATIDLSSASDTVSLNLVRDLLPSDWCELLELFRSPKVRLDGRWIELEKFSSMGNGYTFELESLIFWALARQYDPRAVTFGDDIIVTQNAAPLVIRTLNVLGFNVNEKKTYMAGVFFESCGSDYWHGQNVRPFYFKANYHDHPSAIIRMANAIRRYAARRHTGILCDMRFHPVWLRLLRRCSYARQTFVPELHGDDGLLMAFDEACPDVLRHGHQGFKAVVWRGSPLKVDCTERWSGVVASIMGYADPLRKLLRPYRADPKLTHSGTSQVLRGEVSASRIRDMPVFQWHDPGLWLN